MLCCSAAGEKLKPLIIGNDASPRAFKQNNVTADNNLTLTGMQNKKAWMEIAIILDWLNQLNETMKKMNRRIILFVDNASAILFTRN